MRSLHLDHIVDTATLCASELVTNACLHVDGSGSLLWPAVDTTEIRITVYDGGLNPPTAHPTDPTAECGRGLQLVAAPADKWCMSEGAPLGLGGTAGKGVWFLCGTGT